MKFATLPLLLLLASAATVSTAATLPDDPGKTSTEASSSKVSKPKKVRAPLFAPRKQKETPYARAKRRNELLR